MTFRSNVPGGPPPVQIGAHLGIRHVQVHGLLFVAGGVLVPKEQEMGDHAVVEVQVREVEVEPPARVLLAEDDQQQGRDE